MKVFLLFEQSGTFKNEFKKLGYQAYDFDILNDFHETDFQVDLFKEIENAYNDKPSLFDNITREDLIMSFFPCTRFEVQIGLYFRGSASGQKNWTNLKKLEYAMGLHKELSMFYQLFSMCVCVCEKRGLKMIIENPMRSYLDNYFPIKPSLSITDRTQYGDHFEKPTHFWFINCKPKNNFIFECQYVKENPKKISETHNKVERSMISKEFANRFIREFIL